MEKLLTTVTENMTWKKREGNGLSDMMDIVEKSLTELTETNGLPKLTGMNLKNNGNVPAYNYRTKMASLNQYMKITHLISLGDTVNMFRHLQVCH